jgi:transcriptional regulator with XRE-family HTH domain
MDDYRFIDKDPILDIVRTEVQRSGKTSKFISERSGVSVATLNAWFKGKTRRPQHITVKYVLDAIGCKMQVVRKSDDSVIRQPRTLRVVARDGARVSNG